MAMKKCSLTFLFLVFSFLWASNLFYATEASSSSYSSASVVSGLSYTFYNSTCPNMESIIRTHLKEVFDDDIGQAAGLLRLHFHDCIVQGCDASLLLDGTASDPGEQQAAPNLSLRAKAFEIINDLQSLLNDQCGQVVSCADIVTVAARDSVYLAGGPDYDVPLGRRDSLNFATLSEVIASIPSAFSNITALLAAFANFDITEVVALSGAHTIGLAHCTSFINRLYPIQDPTLNSSFAKDLKLTCPTITTTNTTNLDIRTPNAFDNKYYVNLVHHQGLMTTDQGLYTNLITRAKVKSFAENQTLFFEKFVSAIVKMGQLSVLTGTEGEIRANCSAPNSDSSEYLASVVDHVEELGGFV